MRTLVTAPPPRHLLSPRCPKSFRLLRSSHRHRHHTEHPACKEPPRIDRLRAVCPLATSVKPSLRPRALPPSSSTLCLPERAHARLRGPRDVRCTREKFRRRFSPIPSHFHTFPVRPSYIIHIYNTPSCSSL
ncbi:hypothetical protein K523DRAFT_379484, partial [Schizophyllum commune Tattone D]